MPKMSREEMVKRVLWNRDGRGCDIRPFATSSEQINNGSQLDYPSIVAVTGSPEKYTDDELEQIVAFAERATAKYDEIFGRGRGSRNGANFILIGKMNFGDGVEWLREKLTWTTGPRYSRTLQEAIAFMEGR